MSSIPELGNSPGEGNPLQYSCLENPMGRGVWCPSVFGQRGGYDLMSEQQQGYFESL